jgi:PAS domain S-box-containing protein
MRTKPPGKGKFKAPLKRAPKIISPPSSRLLYLVMALVTVVILVAGYLVYHLQEQQMCQRVEGGLSIVAQLKAEQITEWRAARLVDVNTLAGSSFFTEGVANYMASPTDTEIRDKVLADLALVAQSYPYQDILLVDVNGKVLLSVKDSVPCLSDVTLAQLAVAIKGHKAVITDFHYPPDSNSPHLDVIAPLFPWGQDSQPAIGAVVFSIDPSQYLYPLVQSWPIPSETAETLLVERDGDQVLFLSELRHQKDTALKLRIPLSQQEAPAVMAVLGKEGVVEGRDYRGVEVLAALKHIPDSPWYMVAKIDTSEALAAWRFRAGIILAFFAGLLAAALAAIGLIWQRRQRLAYQALYQAEEMLRLFNERYRVLFDTNIDGLCVMDETMKVLLVNEAAARIFGFGSAEEVLEVNPFDFIPPQEKERVLEAITKDMFENDKKQVNEFQLVNKAGREVWISAVGAVIEYQGKPAGLISFRDVTEQKRAEGMLRVSEAKYRNLVEQAWDAIFVVDVSGKILLVNQQACRMLGYTEEELLQLNIADTYLVEERGVAAERIAMAQRGQPLRYDRLMLRKDGTIIPVEVNIGLLPNGLIQGIVRDITERKRAEESLKHLNLTLRAIRNVNQLIARRTDRDGLLKGACENFVTTRGYYNAWVALLDESGSLVTAAEAGLGKNFLQMIERLKRGELPDCGRKVLKKSGVVVIEDPSSACADCPLAKDYSGKREMSVRLEYGGKVYGLMTVSVPSGVGGEKEEQELFGEVVGDIAFALYSMEQEGERKRAEEALRRSEQNFRDSIENSPLGIRIVTADGETLYANRALLDIWGYSSIEELEAVPRNQRYTPESYAQHQERKEKRSRGEFVPASYEISIVRKDGEVRNLVVSRGEVQWNGKRQFQVAYQDITERKRAEEALRQSMQKYRLLADNANDIIWTMDMNLKFTYMSPSVERIRGYTVEEVMQQSVEEIFTPSSLEIALKVYEEELAIESMPHRDLSRTRTVELEHTCKDGSTVWVEINMAFLHDQDGQPVGILGVSRDITERKRAEEELRQSEEKYRTILKEIEDSYFEVDLAGNLTFVNDSTCRNLRYSRGELLGMNYRGFTAEEDIQHVYKAFNRVYRTNRPNRGICWKVVRKDGTVGFVEATVSLVRDPQGKIIGFRGVGRDITERKKVEEERKQLELKAQVTSRLASVGEMAAGVAHEINNPLTGVIGYAQLLMDREDIPFDIRKDLTAINDGAQRVAGVVKRLLAFSRQTKPERRYVDINELIESTLALRAYHLNVNNIKVTTQLAPDVPETVADPGQLQQVLLNLIVNAETEMKLAHGKGKLTITTEKSHNTIKVSVKDDGPGIAKENLERIFDPFFTTREVGEGTGLGLSLCYGIIAEHKGRIYAESKLGKGATFIVELPVVTEAEPPKPIEPVVEQPEKVAKARILVVDDEQVIRELAKRALAGEGYEVDTVDNAAEALKKIESQRYNLVLIDIKMPDMDGVELYRRTQRIAKSLARRVVFITGDILGADTEKFLSETKAVHIEKPFDAEQLRREVNRALSGGQ